MHARGWARVYGCAHACVGVCVCMYGYACVHGVVHVRVVVHGTLVCVGVRMLLKGIEQ